MALSGGGTSLAGTNVLFREVHKNAWLRRIPVSDKKTGAHPKVISFIIFFFFLIILWLLLPSKVKFCEIIYYYKLCDKLYLVITELTFRL